MGSQAADGPAKRSQAQGHSAGEGQPKDRSPKAHKEAPRRSSKASTQGRSHGNAKPGSHHRSAPGNRATPARTAAVATLRQLRERDGFAQEVIGAVIDPAPLSPEDKGFATRLVLGVVSTKGVLDDFIDRCLRSPRDINGTVRDALEVSAYELLYLRKAPHAAVDQGVELVRSVAPRAGGLANAVLRKMAKARDAFPFGDPSRDIGAYARLHGFPKWLAEMLVADLGAAAAHEFMVASNEPAPLFVAVNAARATDEEVLSVLREAKEDPQPVAIDGDPVPGCYRLQNGAVLMDGRVKRLLGGGAMLVSDAASQAVAARVAAASGRSASFLEVGAGRGTKTILLQSDFQRQQGCQVASFTTVDLHRFKSDLLKARAQDYGVEVAEALTGDATKLDGLVGQRRFDAVFIDAPCTGLGTLRRHGDIRWRLREPMIAESAALDGRLLAAAAPHVSPGGLLAYATCTVTPEENQQAVERFLASPDGEGFALEAQDGQPFFAPALRPGGCDAHFLALMRRRD